MKLDGIKKIIRAQIPEERIWRSNIAGDDDYFYVKIIEKSEKVKKGYVHCITNIGHRRYGSWKQFDIKIKDGTTKRHVLGMIENLVKYYNSCIGAKESYAEGFRQHVEATGGHNGNPVWMD